MTEVECDKCGYPWEYSGSMKRATCPSCQHKTLVEPEDDDD